MNSLPQWANYVIAISIVAGFFIVLLKIGKKDSYDNHPKAWKQPRDKR